MKTKKEQPISETVSHTIRLYNSHTDYKRIYAELFNSSGRNDGVKIEDIENNDPELKRLKSALKDSSIKLKYIRIMAVGQDYLKQKNIWHHMDVSYIFGDGSSIKKPIPLATKKSAYQFANDIVDFPHELEECKCLDIDFGFTIYPESGIHVSFIFHKK